MGRRARSDGAQGHGVRATPDVPDATRGVVGELFGLTKVEYLQWVDLDGAPLCGHRTAGGNLSRNMTGGFRLRNGRSGTVNSSALFTCVKAPTAEPNGWDASARQMQTQRADSVMLERSIKKESWDLVAECYPLQSLREIWYNSAYRAGVSNNGESDRDRLI